MTNRVVKFRSAVSPRHWLLCLMVTALVGMGSAQSNSAAGKTPEETETVFNGYVVHQSIEAGGRVSDFTGSEGMYETLVDQHSGPRVFEQTLSMQSKNHESLLFDNLFVTTYGWGGDPENAFRARINKVKWYDFRANFRRDHNFFDYNLLANPLNPSTSTPALQVEASPHLFATKRRMSDVDLTLLPQSRVSFRLGYSRNNMTGPSFTSFHEGVDVSLFQPWNTTLDTYRAGVDVRVLPQTVLSYDQTLDYYKGDNNAFLSPFFQANVPGAGAVELGLPVNTGASQPCAVTGANTTLVDANGNLTNLACSGYFAYDRLQRVRTSTPTERVSLRSSEIRWLDLAASWSYASADMTSPYSEFFNGLVSRTRTRQYTITGAAKAHQISNVADFTATIHLPHHFRVVNTLYHWAYRIPENFDSTETDWNIPGTGSCRPPACSLLTPLASTTQTVTPGADVFSFNQNLTRNQTELVWDGSKYGGARIGYRVGRRQLFHVLDFVNGDVDDITINEHTGLFGVWAHPVKALRMNFDLEHTNFDNTLVRVAPRKQVLYRARATYMPRPWASLNLSSNVQEGSNGDPLVDYRSHSRSYGATFSVNPRERFGFDFSYNFNDIKQNTVVCFNDTPPVGVVLPVVTGAGDCSANDSANPLLTDGFYENNINFFLLSLQIKPVKRVTAHLGYSANKVDGKTPQFNALQPLGTLAYNFYQPVASIDVDLVHNLAWHAGYNYYQYDENDVAGPTSSRYFHANNVTLSLRYAF